MHENDTTTDQRGRDTSRDANTPEKPVRFVSPYKTDKAPEAPAPATPAPAEPAVVQSVNDVPGVAPTEKPSPAAPNAGEHVATPYEAVNAPRQHAYVPEGEAAGMPRNTTPQRETPAHEKGVPPKVESSEPPIAGAPGQTKADNDLLDFADLAAAAEELNGTGDEPEVKTGQDGGEFHPLQEFNADFESEPAPEAPPAPPRKRGGWPFMALGAVLGVVFVGGALALAYKKNAGRDLGSASGKPPVIRADNRPFKTVPKKPGGKSFPHQNKLIYDRIQGEESRVVERIVPREEKVMVAPKTTPGKPRSLGKGVLDKTKSALRAAKNKIESTAPRVIKVPRPSAAPLLSRPPISAAPRKVKTVTIRPDGSIVAPAKPVMPPPAVTGGSQGLTSHIGMIGNMPAAVPPKAAPKPAPAKVASKPAARELKLRPSQTPEAAPAVKPKPAPAPKLKVASRPAKPVPVASSGAYVVQVAARRSQTDALAAFADLQQKYFRLIGSYRPLIQRADLGAKGVYYRLRVGPLPGKQAAVSLCKNLKSAGLRDCIVRRQ